MQVEQEFRLTISVRSKGVRGSLTCTVALFEAATPFYAQNRTAL